MKLYFYILDTYGENPKGLYVKECEAEEKPKTYKAVKGSSMSSDLFKSKSKEK